MLKQQIISRKHNQFCLHMITSLMNYNYCYFFQVNRIIASFNEYNHLTEDG